MLSHTTAVSGAVKTAVPQKPQPKKQSDTTPTTLLLHVHTGPLRIQQNNRSRHTNRVTTLDVGIGSQQALYVGDITTAARPQKFGHRCSVSQGPRNQVKGKGWWSLNFEGRITRDRGANRSG